MTNEKNKLSHLEMLLAIVAAAVVTIPLAVFGRIYGGKFGGILETIIFIVLVYLFMGFLKNRKEKQKSGEEPTNPMSRMKLKAKPLDILIFVIVLILLFALAVFLYNYSKTSKCIEECDYDKLLCENQCNSYKEAKEMGVGDFFALYGTTFEKCIENCGSLYDGCKAKC